MKRAEEGEGVSQTATKGGEEEQSGTPCRSPLPKTGINPIIAREKNLLNIPLHVCRSMSSAVCKCACESCGDLRDTLTRHSKNPAAHMHMSPQLGLQKFIFAAHSDTRASVTNVSGSAGDFASVSAH